MLFKSKYFDLEIHFLNWDLQFQCGPLGFRTKIYFVVRAGGDLGIRCSEPRNKPLLYKVIIFKRDVIISYVDDQYTS